MGERKIFLIDFISFFCCLFASLDNLKVDFFVVFLKDEIRCSEDEEISVFQQMLTIISKL